METKKKVLSNMIWRFAERCGAQGVSFVVSIIIARLVEPDVFGEIAIVTVFINILSVFVDAGLGNALIQKKDPDDTDFSSVFYFNMAICIILYFMMFVLAPKITIFYKMPDLILIIRVLSLTLIISGVKNVQQAYVAKHMMFRKFFFSTLIGTITSAVVGIAMAYAGFGVWALIAQQMTNICMDTFILWLTVSWRPKRTFSLKRVKEMFGFGGKLLLSTLIDTIYENARQFFVGKVYSASDLAFYNKGSQMPQLLVQNVNTSIDSVLFPTISEEKDDISRVKNITRRAMKTSSYVMWPCMVGLGVCAEPLVRILLTEKWIMCVPYIQIFCFTYAWWPIYTANLNAIKGLGKSNIFLQLEVLKKIVGILMIFITLQHGALVIAIGYAAASPANAIINAFPNRKLLNYTIFEQVKDLLPIAALSLGMGCVIYGLKYMIGNDILLLCTQILAGTIVYVAGSLLFKLDSFNYILDIVKQYRKK